MTPKEKAIEIVEKYQSGYVSNGFTYQLANDLTDAKHCAIIAVDEILNLKRNDFTKGMYISVTPTDELYWHEVREEIRKL